MERSGRGAGDGGGTRLPDNSPISPSTEERILNKAKVGGVFTRQRKSVKDRVALGAREGCKERRGEEANGFFSQWQSRQPRLDHRAEPEKRE